MTNAVFLGEMIETFSSLFEQLPVAEIEACCADPVHPASGRSVITLYKLMDEGRLKLEVAVAKCLKFAPPPALSSIP
ncbi:hypothetical protein G6L68_25420 [Agrobacterium fabrum]|uniref:hypothetical protein n=1 Tax=Agrobacterium fabrum TaxID=1176649 RepID=UPI000EF56E50|nr:hypothetical protein [Agrobacterium fabrum]NTE63975.1 hypothetical protein [Agrobacterium fabrum]